MHAPPTARIPLLVWLCAAAFFALQFGFGPRYPVFRDEFYYLACSHHLAWGYVDHPPLSIFVLAGWTALFGDSLASLRFLPSLAGAATLLMVSDLAGLLTGSAFARTFAAVAMLAAPTVFGITGFYSMNAFDLVFWLGAILIVAHMCRSDATARAKLWPLLGLVLGLGLLNKLSVGALGAGIAAATILTPLRVDLRTRGPWIAAGLAIALFAPHLVWQVQNGWPTLEFVRNASQFKNVSLGPLGFLLAQVSAFGPWSVLLWAPGLIWLVLGAGGRFRALAVVFAASFLAFMNGKAYYLAPAMLVPLTAGAGILGRRLERPKLAWVRSLLLVQWLSFAAVAMPIVVPLLSPEQLDIYLSRLGMVPKPAERSESGVLPQHHADRFGWQELASLTARAWQSLTREEQARAIIVTGNYGEAGAIDYYGPALGLPPARSQHNNYYLWGPGNPNATIVIAVGMSPEGLSEVFGDVRPTFSLTDPFAMPYEREHPVTVCRRPKALLRDAWVRGRHYI